MNKGQLKHCYERFYGLIKQAAIRSSCNRVCTSVHVFGGVGVPIFLKVRSCNLNPCPFLSEAPLLCHTPLFGQSARTVQSAVLRLRTDLPTKSCAFGGLHVPFCDRPLPLTNLFLASSHRHTHTFQPHKSKTFVGKLLWTNWHGDL